MEGLGRGAREGGGGTLATHTRELQAWHYYHYVHVEANVCNCTMCLYIPGHLGLLIYLFTYPSIYLYIHLHISYSFVFKNVHCNTSLTVSSHLHFKGKYPTLPVKLIKGQMGLINLIDSRRLGCAIFRHLFSFKYILSTDERGGREGQRGGEVVR